MKPGEEPLRNERPGLMNLATPAVIGAPPASQVSSSAIATRPSSKAYALIQHTVSGVVLYLSRRAQYVGRSGIVGVALIVFTVASLLTANWAQHLQLAELRADLTTAQRTAAARRVAGPDLSAAEGLQTFVRNLPARAELPAITEQIVTQAAAAGLQLERGSYDFTVAPSGQIVRFRMSFPVLGAYPNIRTFVDGTLAAVPNAAVDGLKLERKNIASGEIEADIRFAVFLRNVQ
jgi:Tfp pilus assembly protein PilO